MNHVHACLDFTVTSLVLSSHNNEGTCCGIKHFRKTGNVGNAGDGETIELIIRQTKSVSDEVFEVFPYRRVPVADEDVSPDPSVPHSFSLGAREVCGKLFKSSC